MPRRNTYVNMKPNAIIIDIDETISKKESGRIPFDWSRVLNDTPIFPTILIVQAFHLQNVKVIFSTARDCAARNDSRKWLENYLGFSDFDLYMREKEFRYSSRKKKDGTFLSGDGIKKNNYKNFIEPNYNVIAVFDDLDSCVKMYRELGLLTYQVFC